MKNYIKILIPIAILGGFTSCSNLEEEPYGFYSESNFYNNAAEAKSALTYAYDALTYLEYSRSYFVLGDLASEECYPKNDESVSLHSLNNWDYTNLKNNATLTNFFKYAYISINRANSVIQNVEKANFPQAEKNEILGEAYFLRAWNYFNLVKAFGNVPMHFETVGSLEQTAAPLSKNLDEIYDRIIEDCEKSISLLKVNQRLGRIDLVGSQALLSKVYLHIASSKNYNVPLYIEMSKDTNKMYQLAGQYAESVLEQQGVYGFEQNLVDIYDVMKPLGKENIFLLSMDRTGTSEGDYSKISKLFIPYIAGGTIHLKNPDGSLTKSHDGWSTYMTNVSFYESYDSADKRKTDLMVDVVYNDKGEATAKFPGSISYPFTRKYIDPNFIGDKTSTKPFLLRYSDIALVYAEAVGPTSKGYQYVNHIRNRAGLSSLQSGLGIEEFRKAILEERKFELAWEGNRLYDLRRFNLVSQYVPEAAGLSSEQTCFYPIPQLEIDLNNNL